MPSNQSGLSSMPLLRGCGPDAVTLGSEPVGTTLRTRVPGFAAAAAAGLAAVAGFVAVGLMVVGLMVVGLMVVGLMLAGLASPDAFSVLSMMGLVEEEAGCLVVGDEGVEISGAQARERDRMFRTPGAMPIEKSAVGGNSEVEADGAGVELGIDDTALGIDVAAEDVADRALRA